MLRFSGRRLTGVTTSVLFVLATFAVALFLSGTFDSVLAADSPGYANGQSGEVDALDIPGSFKDLPAAKDAVTAKLDRSQIDGPPINNTTAPEASIDAEKASASGMPIVDQEMTDFHATAYCLKGRTASGVNTRPGVIAADPRVLPLGTVVHLQAGSYTGTYTVLDTGGRIKGRRVDVYVPTYREAIQFGRRQVKIKVIARGTGKTGAPRKAL